MATRAEYRTRHTAPRAEQAKPYVEAVIETLNAQIEAIDAAIKAGLKQDKALGDAVKRLCAINGIGVTTAVERLTLMPELGTLDRRKIASLGGLAPHPHQSGSLDRHRFVRGGRRHLKSLLFMPALSAARCHPALSAFYQRKIA